MIQISDSIALDESDIRYAFIRSRGPGGQHVNRSATGVQLRFDLGQCRSLPAAVRQRLVRLAAGRLSRDGIIVIEASTFRSQHQNRKDALDRLVRLIRQAAMPVVSRRATRPSLAARKRRMAAKRHRSRVKENRKRPLDRDG